MLSPENIVKPELEGDDFYWQGNSTGILLIHGFTATTAEVRLAAEKLHQAGYTTAGPLLPGHGTDPDELNRTPWQMWLEKVKTFYERLQRDCDRVFVIGESMGSLLALLLAAQHPEIKGLCLFAPAIKVPNLWFSRWMAPFKAHLEKNMEEDGLAWQGYRVYPIKAMVQMLKLQQHTRKILPQIQQPTLVFTGEYDRSIAPESADIILKGIHSRMKTHLHMKESPHCILLAGELDQVIQRIIKFIEDQS